MNRYPSRQPNRSLTIDDVRRIVRERDQLALALRELNDRHADDVARIAELEAQLADQANADDLRGECEALRTQLDNRDTTIAELRERLHEAEAVEDDDLVVRLERKVAELTDDLARAQRREQQATDQASRAERRRLLGRLGDVLDSVDRAVEAANEDDPWHAGLVGIRDQLLQFFTAEGAILTGQVGETMDPNVHEALGLVEADDFDRGEIVRVHRPGITLADGTVVRSAQVLVAG